MGRHAELTEKHWKALKLIEDGNLTIREIARTLDWNEDTLYELYEGRTEKHGKVAEAFQEELAKITSRNIKRIRELTKDSQVLALRVVNAYLRNNQKKKPDKSLVALCNTVLNALSKSVPNVQIDSFSYTKGLSAEDLINEFKRLRGLASNGSRISEAFEGKPGEVPGTSEYGSTPEEEPEAPLL